MAYAQIAQKTIVRSREDGSSVSIRITFEQDGASAAALNIPLVEDIVVTHGDRQDQIDKPLKVSKCEFNFTDVPAASDLIYRIDGAAIREIRVTVENITDSYTEFVGYVVPDRTDFQLYEDVQRVSVMATGNLQFVEEIAAVDAFRTIRGMGEDVNTASALTRAIDLFTSMRHNTQALADEIPNYIRGNQKMMAGNADDSTLLDAVSGMCAVFGWQIFQRNGRLTIAEVYERAFNPTTVNRYQDDGAGNYTQGTENVRVQLTAANVIRGGKFNNTRSVTRRTQQFNLITRDTVPSIFEDTDEVLYGNTNTFVNSAGLIQGGDVITVSFWGRAIATTPVDNDVNWTGEIANVTLKSVIGGPDVEILSVTPSVAFLTGGSNEFSWGNTGTPVVFEVPEGFIGTIEAKHIFQGGTFADGSAADLDKSVADKLTIGVAPAEGGTEELYHFFDAASTDPLGQLITRSFFLADEDQYSVQQAFQFSTDGFSFANTTTWIDAGGNDTLPAVTARRLGDVVVGSGLKFSVQLRDADRVDLMTVFTIVDNNGVTHTCLPLEIKHSVLRGFYSVRMREVFDQRNAAADDDSYALEPRGTTTAGGSSSGGGGTSGAVWGAITGTLAAQTDLQAALDAKVDQSEFDTFETATNNALASKANQSDLTNHVNNTNNPHATDRDDVGLGTTSEPTFKSINGTDGVKAGGTLFVDGSRNGSFASGEFTNYLQLPVGVDKFT